LREIIQIFELYNLTLESLQIVDAIARKGSFAAAAEALDKVPSAITYSAQAGR
jgi:DNA-binding transcriptional LysR family regulator